MQQALIIGNEADPHAAAVAAECDCPVVVIDAKTLASVRFVLVDGAFEFESDTLRATVSGGRGWVRRIAPAGWEDGVILGSHEAAVKTAWLSLMASLARVSRVDWLTAPEVLGPAEDKMLQYSVARALGLPVPEAMVTSEPERAGTELGLPFVVKPLGPGHYVDEGVPKVVFATAVWSVSDLGPAFAGAPFIAQRLIKATSHLRVVTVRDQVWINAAPAPEDQLDWRMVPAAHRGFVPVSAPTAVAIGARRLAEALGCGYSSQDWLVDGHGQHWFLDLNPGGQWLFLADAVSSEVTRAIAAWLSLGDG